MKLVDNQRVSQRSGCSAWGNGTLLLFTVSQVFFGKRVINNILNLKNHRKVSTLSTPLCGFLSSCDQKCKFFQDRIIWLKWDLLKMSMFHSVPGVPRRKMERLSAFTGLIHP